MSGIANVSHKTFFAGRARLVAWLMILLGGLALSAVGGCAWGTQTGVPEDHLSLAQTAFHVRYLSSDELRGREPGTIGEQAAARYIAEHFRAVGVQPAPGKEDFMQPFVLVTLAPDEEGFVSLHGKTYRQGEGLAAGRGRALQGTQPYVFVGFGMEEDYDGVDAQGKVVIARAGTPEAPGSPAAYAAKRALAADKGASAFFEVVGEDEADRERLTSRPRRPVLEDESLGMFEARLFDAAGQLVDRFDQDRQGSIRLSTRGLVPQQRITAHNVVGMIEGSDPARKEEVVLLSAHYDHMGAGMDKRGATAADSIFNGARDNGFGTTALLNAAEALAAAPPARSVLLVAFSAEEMGLLGSRYYANHPLVPLERTVFVFNTDGAGYSDTRAATVFGLGRTTADAAVEEGIRAAGLEVRDDPQPQLGIYRRSDHFSFAVKGVPSVMMSPDFQSLSEPGVGNYYHQPADEVDEHFDMDYLLRFSKAYARAARRLADMPSRPQWTPGDPYEAAGRALYGE